MKKHIAKQSFNEFLEDLREKFPAAVHSFLQDLQEAGFQTIGHAMAHKDASGTFLSDFFHKNLVMWEADEFIKADSDSIKKEFERAFHNLQIKLERIEAETGTSPTRVYVQKKEQATFADSNKNWTSINTSSLSYGRTFNFARL